MREVSFARDRAGATYTAALEGRTGYATQVAGLRELTDTTEKSIRDLDQRYQEAIMSNDANTAFQLSQLRMQKLDFQQRQEESFYSNLFSLANLQGQALDRAQQNEQFWKNADMENKQFVIELTQSKYEFEKNLGLRLQEIGLQEQQLDLERSKYSLSIKEYNDKKQALYKDKTYTNTKALIAQDIRNKLSENVPSNFFLTPDYMALVAEQTGFDGSTEELASIIKDAFGSVSSSTYGPKVPYTSNKELNQVILQGNNLKKVSEDKARGVTIQSPESYWSRLFSN